MDLDNATSGLYKGYTNVWHTECTKVEFSIYVTCINVCVRLCLPLPLSIFHQFLSAFVCNWFENPSLQMIYHYSFGVNQEWDLLIGGIDLNWLRSKWKKIGLFHRIMLGTWWKPNMVTLKTHTHLKRKTSTSIYKTIRKAFSYFERRKN